MLRRPPGLRALVARVRLGPMTEPIPFWEDWRVWSVAAAFLGFTFGTWVKHAFDLRLDRIRRDKENTAFAVAFSAELEGLVSDARMRLRRLKSIRELDTPLTISNTVVLDIPAKPMYANNTHRLGGLGDRVALSVVDAHGTADHIRHNVTAALEQPPGTAVEKPDLEVMRSNFGRLIEDAAKAVNALDAFLGDPERYPDPEALAAEADPAGDH